MAAPLSCADPVLTGRRPYRRCRLWQGIDEHRGVIEPVHAWTFQTRLRSLENGAGDPISLK